MIHEIGMTVAVGKVRSLCGLKVQVFIKEGHFLDDIAHFPAIGTGIHEHGTAKAAGNTDGKREAAQSMGSRQLGNLRKGHAAAGAQFVTSHELRAPFIQMNNKASNAAVTDEHIGAFP